MPSNKAIKLSPKQKEVIRLMRDGAIMFVPHPYFVPKNNKIIIRKGSDYIIFNNITFNSLRAKDIIYQYKYNHSDSSIYRLTELGKTCIID